MGIAVVIKTFLREQPIIDLVESIEKELPEARIYIADDSGEISTKKNELYERLRANGHKIILMPFDSGLPAGRNACINEVKEEYILLCDDDFVISDGECIRKTIKKLTKGVDIICGRLYKENGEMYNDYIYRVEIKDSTLIRHPLPSVWSKIDIGLNFFVAKSKVIKSIMWDAELKLIGEHPDFFMRAKNVYFDPEMTAIHKEVENTKEYRSFRSRTEFLGPFSKKWGVKKEIVAGEKFRLIYKGNK